MHRHARKCPGQLEGGGGGGEGDGSSAAGDTLLEDEEKNRILTLEVNYDEEYRNVARHAAIEQA